MARVLVTGATGRIGRRLTSALLARGHQVRGLTSKLPPDEPAIDWRRMDWSLSIDFVPHVEGCDAVLHLGAEMIDIARMQRINVEATESLARAAEAAGVKFFGYTSSVAVYGSPLKAEVTEQSPTLTVARDVKSEYRGNAVIRAYGRTKLLGEMKLLEAASRMECNIFRPTVVVDEADIAAMAHWGGLRKVLLGLRHAHYIYVDDVNAALIWFLERALARGPVAGVEVYNLSDDDAPNVTMASFLRLLHARTGKPAHASTLHAPLLVYDLFDMAKNRMVSLRRPIGLTRYSPEKLYAAGYRHSYGLDAAYARAIAVVVGGA